MNYHDKETADLRTLLDPGPVPPCVEAGLQKAYASLRTVPQQPRRTRPAVRVLRTALVAAAVCLACSTAVLATTGQLLPMVQGAVAFFRKETPTTLDSIQPTFEAYNAAVNAEKTDAGITFTVDTVSVDDNFINVFGRIKMPGLRAKVQEVNTMSDEPMFAGEMPDHWALFFGANLYPVVKIDGTVYGFDNSLNDAINLYFEDDDTISYARRILVSDALPDTFTMQVLPSYSTSPSADGTGVQEEQFVMGLSGDWTIDVAVDITATKGAVKSAAAQELQLGTQKLALEKFSVSPLGAIAVVNEHQGEYPTTLPDGTPTTGYGPLDGYSALPQYAVRDSAGKWLYWMQPAAYGASEALYEFTKPTDSASSITFVPIRYEESAVPEKAYVSLQAGAKIAMNNLFGYTLQSYKLEGRHFEAVLMPYGPQTHGGIGLEFVLCDAAGNVTYDENRNHICLMDSYTDHATGAVTFTVDFYNDEPGLASTTQLRYTPFTSAQLDEANAATVPLI